MNSLFYYWTAIIDFTLEISYKIEDYISKNDRFSALEEIAFPSWITHPVMVTLNVADIQYFKALFNIKDTIISICKEIETKC